jgi:hypothetical protein
MYVTNRGTTDIPHIFLFQNILSLGVLAYFFLYWYSGVQLGPPGSTATNRPIVPALGDYDGEKLVEW